MTALTVMSAQAAARRGVKFAADLARAHDSLDRLAERRRMLAALDDGSVHWSAVYDEADLPPGPCKQTAAIELAEQHAVEARLELLRADR